MTPEDIERMIRILDYSGLYGIPNPHHKMLNYAVLKVADEIRNLRGEVKGLRSELVGLKAQIDALAEIASEAAKHAAHLHNLENIALVIDKEQ